MIFTQIRTFVIVPKNKVIFMSKLYESILSLCTEAGIKGGKMCVDLGLSKSLMTDLKAGRKSGISASTAQKIADYFGVSVDRVLGVEKKEKPNVPEDIAPNKQKLLNLIDDLSETEAALLLERIQKIKESRV